jgi:NCS1 family nucleobase:cation symporter-1
MHHIFKFIMLIVFLAGFVRRVRGTNTQNGWDHVYDMSYFFGFFVSLTVHCLLHTIFPAKKQTGASPFMLELHRTAPIIIGHGASDHADSNDEVKVSKVGKETIVPV